MPFHFRRSVINTSFAQGGQGCQYSRILEKRDKAYIETLNKTRGIPTKQAYAGTDKVHCMSRKMLLKYKQTPSLYPLSNAQ
jgi:hypothetical protein